MTTRYLLISRHSGSIQFCQNLFKKYDLEFALVAPELDIDLVKKGDFIIGNLPPALIYKANRKGARYFHIETSTPLEQRGKELTAFELKQLGVSIVEYECTRLGFFTPSKDDAL